jgi:hypothetical protein
MRTNGRNGKPWAVAAAALLALTLSPAPAARAGEGEARRGTRQGIKVHGHWTIDIKNPDGSLVSHHVFENSLASGAVSLPQILARTLVPGAWTVVLQPGTSGLRKPCPHHRLGSCRIGESGEQFNTLTVDVPASGPSAGKLVLSGHATAEAEGDVFEVYTELGLCPATTLPAVCATSAKGGTESPRFTWHSLPTPIVALANQIIQVTVVISFSSAS